MNKEQIEYWNGGGGDVWVAQNDRLQRQLAPLGRAALAALAPRAGEKILDVGCGSGETTAAIAEAVGPSGRVVGIDISAPLLAEAERRKRHAQVAFVQADAQTRPFDERFDAIFSRFGVMFFEDPVAAFTNLGRAVAPGGRVAFICWRTLAENPLMATPMAAASRHLPPLPPSPPPDAPGPFAFADRGRTTRILEAAGWRDVTMTPHDEPIGGNDREATYELAFEIGPLGRFLREHPDRRDAVNDAVRAALEPFIVDGIASAPSATWIVTARR